MLSIFGLSRIAVNAQVPNNPGNLILLLIQSTIHLLHFPYDAELLNILNQKTPQKYKIAGIKVTGNKYFDQALLISVSGLSVGDEISTSRC